MQCYCALRLLHPRSWTLKGNMTLVHTVASLPSVLGRGRRKTCAARDAAMGGVGLILAPSPVVLARMASFGGAQTLLFSVSRWKRSLPIPLMIRRGNPGDNSISATGVILVKQISVLFPWVTHRQSAKCLLSEGWGKDSEGICYNLI